MRRAIFMLSLTVAIGSSGRLVAQVPQGQSFDKRAQEQYNNGLRLMKQEAFTEGLKDLGNVASEFSSTIWAAHALVRMIEYDIDIKKDYDEARGLSAKLHQYEKNQDKKFAAVGALAALFDARITLATGRSTKEIDAAINDFDRLELFSAGNERIPEASYYAAEAARLGGRIDDAIDRYRTVAERYPRSIWTARALVQYAGCLVWKGQALEALSALQRVRSTFDKNAEAEVAAAIDLSTVIYRLHVRAPDKQPLYVFKGKVIVPSTGKFQGDPFGMSVAPSGQLLVADRDGVSVFDTSGEYLRAIRSSEVSLALFFKDRRVAYVAKNALHIEGATGEAVLTQPPQPDGKVRPIEEATAMAFNWHGDSLVADPKLKTIWIFRAPKGFADSPKVFVPPAADITPDRMIVNNQDQVVVLDRDKKTVTVFDRDGKQVTQIASKTPTYQLDNPVDLAVDTLGYIYVLDRGKGTLLVFTPQGALHVMLSLPEKDPGSLRKASALALDEAGRMFVFDEGSHRVLVYQ